MASGETAVYQPIKKRRVFEEVCSQIRGRIYEESLRPGDKLPAERDLAQQLGVGRAAVREALRALESAGILTLQKGKKGGAFIQHLDSEIISTSMRDMISLGKVPLNDLIETRVLMNDMVIPLVCKRATDEDFDALDENISAARKAAGLRERLENTRQFYKLLGQASHNQLVMTLLGSLTEVVLDFVERVGPAPMDGVADARHDLVAKLRARDVEGALTISRAIADAMHHHLERHAR
ncbi:FadR/GntR family transcriptional regulator [Sphingopyxis sp. LARHCG72]